MQGIPTAWGRKRKRVFFSGDPPAVAGIMTLVRFYLERWCRQRILELGQEENDVFFLR